VVAAAAAAAAESKPAARNKGTFHTKGTDILF
jgi:hypothetical protein